MGLDFNPSFPDQIGMQRIDAGYGSLPVTTQSEWQSLEFIAKHTGPIDYLEFWGSGATTALGSEHFNQLRPIAVDLYQGETPQYDIFLTQYSPTAVTGSSYIINENLTQPITVSRITGINDGLFVIAAGTNHWVRVQFPTSAFPDGRRVLGVRWLVRVTGPTEVVRVDDSAVGSSWRKTRTFGSTWNNWYVLMTEARTDNDTTPDWGWWTPQHIRDYRAGGPSQLFVRCKNANKWYLDTVRMQVIWTPETRVGAGMSHPATALGWASIPMKTPLVTGAPSVVAGQKYTVVVRQPWQDSEHSIGTATFNWRDLNGTSPIVTGWAPRKIPVSVVSVTGGTLAPIPLAWKPNRVVSPVYKESLPVMLAVTGSPSELGGTVVATSMPYSLSRGVEVRDEHQSGVFTFPERSVEQTVIVTGAATSMTYGRSSALIGWDPGNKPKDDATISMEVWTATGAPDTMVLSTTSHTFREVERVPVTADFPIGEAGREYRMVQFRHPETRVLAPGKYKIVIFANGLTSGTSFFIGANISVNHTVDQTFGGTAEAATGTWGSSTGDHPLTGSDIDGEWSSDLSAVIMTVPPAVTGFAGYVGVSTAHHAEVCNGVTCANPGCADTASPFTQLRWGVTSDAESVRYEIQRSDQVDTTFRTVALVQGRESTEWFDHEGRIGAPSNYRIRSIREDGTTGDWSSTVTTTPPAGQVALTFTSNAATGLAVVYPEIFARDTVTREWLFQEYEDVVIRAIHARERQVAFYPVERRGIRFSRNILLNALCSVSPPTMQLYAPLRTISWAPIPYVCVRDGEGNRWFANVKVPVGTNERPAEFWFAEIEVTEVSDIPYIVDTNTPQVTDETIGPVVL